MEYVPNAVRRGVNIRSFFTCFYSNMAIAGIRSQAKEHHGKTRIFKISEGKQIIKKE
jgi:hypothetical protein